MVARFILSLDCEGRWGVADQLGHHAQSLLTDGRLKQAYASILSLLEELSLPATFAFVGLFGETPANFRRLRPEVERLAAMGSEYLAAALRNIDECRGEGWHGHWAVDAVTAARAGHEVALHGIAHVPWGNVDRAFAAAELNLHPLLMSDVRLARTFIAPRNEVVHLDLLDSIGIEGFREARRTRTRVGSLLSELNVWQRPQPDPPAQQGMPLPIPSGYFVNWRHGLRRTVPRFISCLRLEKMLVQAVERGEIVHLWLHPENVATDPPTLQLLREMLQIVARQRDAGRCEALTQLQYVHSRRPPTAE